MFHSGDEGPTVQKTALPSRDVPLRSHFIGLHGIPAHFSTKEVFLHYLPNYLLPKAFFQELRLMKGKRIQPLKVFVLYLKKGHSFVKCKNVIAVF